MTSGSTDKPGRQGDVATGGGRRDERRARLEAALRDNLRRRKDQARSRDPEPAIRAPGGRQR